MPTIFIHTGAGKTGTSYLQVLFARYRDELAAGGVLYPEDQSLRDAQKGKITSGNGVIMANYLRPHLPHQIKDKEAFLGEFGHVLETAAGKDILYSSEFINFPDNERSKNVREAIDRAGYTPRLIFFVRDIGAAALSVYSQEIKRSGETRLFSEFLATWDPSYRAHANNYLREFGREESERIQLRGRKRPDGRPVLSPDTEFGLRSRG